MGDLREGVSPVVHRVLDKADQLRVSMARFSVNDIAAEIALEVMKDEPGSDAVRLAALAIVAAERVEAADAAGEFVGTAA